VLSNITVPAKIPFFELPATDKILGLTLAQSALNRMHQTETMALTTTSRFHLVLPFLISLIFETTDNVMSLGVIVSAFVPPPPQPTRNAILRTSSRGSTSNLYSLLDSMGGIFSGPKLEAEQHLPYSPPFSSELSISDDVKTFAIKERP
jgi:hypothetical protein